MTIASALIVAAGRGRRMSGDVPKQYRDLAGRAVLTHTVQRFLAHPGVADVQVVIHPDDRDLYVAATAGLAVLEPVLGGQTRQQSVRNGLAAIAARVEPPTPVLIHDGARPLVSDAVIDRVLAARKSVV